MSLKIYLVTAFISLLFAGIAWFVDEKISFGILLSSLFSLVNMLMLSASMKMVIKNKDTGYGALIIGNIIRLTLLMIVIYIAIKNPQIFNIIGVAIGFTLFLIALVADAISKRKG